jgi:uncharacterized membrane protein YraQ (UPF0718 family)/copper chaperone CopZ
MWIESLASEAWLIVTELAPWLFLGAAIAGGLHLLVSDAWLVRMLRGRLGVLRAVLFGVPMPLCSCGVIPAGVSLKRRGVSDASAMAFMISTPQTGVDSILVSASFLGWPFALFKLAAAAILGLVGGLLTTGAPAKTVEADEPKTDGPRNWRSGVEHSVEIIRSIWGWLAFGILASAALSTFVPPEALAGLAEGSGLWAIIAVLAISVPLYVCATASVPIAAALVAGGFPPGAALVFLMAGPATNLATIGAVYRTFGARSLAIYLSTIILGSVALGLAFGGVLAMPDTSGALEHSPAWWQLASGALLLAMMAAFAWESLRPAARLDGTDTESLVELGVDGMTCQGCVRKLEGRLATLSEEHPGSSFEVELDGGFARATGIAPSLLRATIEKAGFSVRAPGPASHSP